MFNDTKVFPARLYGKKDSGGKVEILLLNLDTGEFIGKNIGGAKRVIFDDGLVGEIEKNKILFNVNKNTHDQAVGVFSPCRTSSDIWRSNPRSDDLGITRRDKTELMDKINKIGYTPLPPYIKPREVVTEPNLRRRYQTVYAKDLGSAAAPTAGFHFTKELMEKIPNKVFVTLGLIRNLRW